MKVCSFLIFFLVIQYSAFAQNYEKKIDQFLASELHKLSIPNMEISVVSQDSVLFTKTFGNKKKEDALFYLGSVSKSLTSFGVLKLVEANKLRLDDPLSDIIPEINYEGTSKTITVRNLLNHTSGLNKREGFTYLPSLAEIKKNGFSLSTTIPPGSRYQYSNLNYSLLGLVIEKVSGLAFSDFMALRVFDPLQMTSSKIYPTSQSAIGVVDQYQYWGPVPIKSQQMTFARTSAPAGFILSNARDMSRYLSMCLGRGKLQGTFMLDSSLINAMQTPWNKADTGYGMGWNKGKYNNREIFQHLGSTATSYSAIFLIPQQNIGFVLLTNSNSLSSSEEIAEGILSILTDGEIRKVSRKDFFMRTGILVLILIVLINFFLKARKYLQSDLQQTTQKNRISLGISLIVFVAFLTAFPYVAQIPFWSMMQLQPDVATLILLLFLCPLILNIIRLVPKQIRHKVASAPKH